MKCCFLTHLFYWTKFIVSSYFVYLVSGLCLEVHKDFVGHAHDGIFFDFTGFEFTHTSVRKCGERLVNTRFILQVGIDENVSVCGVAPLISVSESKSRSKGRFIRLHPPQCAIVVR